MGRKCKKLKFDCIVLGVGAAGCPLMFQLSEDRHTTVAIVEAGKYLNNDTFVNGPNRSDPTIPDTNQEYNWPGLTLPDPSTPDLGGTPRIHRWSNGYGFGGGSLVDGQIYSIGSPQRFNQWGAQVGDFWSYPRVKKRVIKMERFFGPTPFPAEHGYDGRMAVRVGVADDTGTPDFTEAIFSTNAPGTVPIKDYNSTQTPMGVYPNWQYWQFPDGTRATAARTFGAADVIGPDGKGRDGRKIQAFFESRALKLIWSKKRGTVKGVHISVKGEPVTIYGDNIFISMGFNSAAYLQVNGVGPAELLQQFNIPVRVDSPNVGTGMKINIFIPNLMSSKPDSRQNSNPATFYSGGAFLPSPDGTNPEERNVELSAIFIAGGALFIPVIEAPLRPKSTGVIRIQSADPLKIAEAQLNLLGDPADLDFTVLCYQTLMLPIFQSLIAKGYALLPFPLAPTIEMLQSPDDSALRAFIQNTASSGHHYMCFNHMGRQEDGAVVDIFGKVHGTNNLYVVDDSIVPKGLNIDGNTKLCAELFGWTLGKKFRKNNSCRNSAKLELELHPKTEKEEKEEKK